MQVLLTESLFFFAGGDPSASTAEAKEQVDARSVYVGNVRFYKLSFSLSLLLVYVHAFCCIFA